MGNVFSVCASNGPHKYAELELPASDYELLDLMERLRLEPGQPPCPEILRYREEYDYLEKAIPELPDLYQLNALARRLSEFTSVQDMAAFEGLVGKELENSALPVPLPRLIDFAHSTDCCYVAEEAATDVRLGKFLVENGFIEEANELPDSALALLDYGRIGRERREAEGGVFTGFGYVEPHSGPRSVSETMDFRPRKPAYTVLLNMAALPLTGPVRREDMIQLRLPAPESQLREALEKLGAKDWNEVAVSIQDSPIPRLNHSMYLDGETPRILELSKCLRELDARGGLPKYKAILEAEDRGDLSRMISLAGAVDEYLLEPQTASPEDMAREELGVILSRRDAETLLPYIDLDGYGRALLEREQGIITGYGLLEREDRQPVRNMSESPGRGGMEMT